MQKELQLIQTLVGYKFLKYLIWLQIIKKIEITKKKILWDYFITSRYIALLTYEDEELKSTYSGLQDAAGKGTHHVNLTTWVWNSKPMWGWKGELNPQSCFQTPSCACKSLLPSTHMCMCTHIHTHIYIHTNIHAL